MDRQELFDKQKVLCKKYNLDFAEVDYALSALRYEEQGKEYDANFYKKMIKGDSDKLWEVARILRGDALK